MRKRQAIFFASNREICVLIVLIGYRCSGKTSVGENMASILKWRFIDSDHVIEDEAGQSIDELVAADGWPGFRERETKAVNRLATLRNTVLATGGGVILNPKNTKTLRRHGTVIWLRADAATIRVRMMKDAKTRSQRPGLTDMGPIQEVEDVLLERTPLYENAAHHVVNTDGKSIGEISNEILMVVKRTI
jgi:shikimate kinase